MRVLIVGAGIGGDALGVLLDRRGWQVEVVEVAPAMRSGGQTVDLRGGSTAVLAELGVLEGCRERLIAQDGIEWVDRSGRRRAAMSAEGFGGQGLVSREELLRTDLALAVHAAAGPAVRYRFGDTVQQLELTDSGVDVRFRSGDRGRFDLVVGADGTHSRVRALVFGPEERFRRPLGLAIAWFTLPEGATTPPLNGWFQVHNAPGSLVVGARPGHRGEQEIGFTFPAVELPDRRDREAQLALLHRLFSGVGWRAEELLAGARLADDFALDTCDQISMPTWVRGRIVLLGDSAWCASPLSGLGTALALQGASALAEEVSGATDGDGLRRGLAEFETRMRPVVRAAQKLPPGRVRMHAPRTAFGIQATVAIWRLLQSRFVETLLTRLLPAAG